MRTLVFVIAITALAPARAGATPSIAADAPVKRGESRTEIDVGYIVGGEDIGTARRFTRGLHVNVGRRFGDLAVLGEYNYLAIGDTGAPGSMTRAGLVARYSLLRTRGEPDDRGRISPVVGDFWIEGGGGVQRIAWDVGGTLTRPDAVLGFGWQLNGVIGRESDQPRYYGPYIAFRAHFSRAPDHSPDVMPTCGGPCDTETRPSLNNLGLFFHFGINWAR